MQQNFAIFIASKENNLLSTIEQFSASSKSNCEARLAMFTALNQTAFDGVTKLVELNLGVMKASLAESTLLSQQLFSAKDPQEFFSLTAAYAQPAGDKMLSYGQRLASIASAAQAEFSQATQATTTEAHSNVMAIVDEVLKKAPAGSEPAVSLVKSAIDHAAAGLGLLHKGTQQAFGAAAKQTSKAA